MRYEIIFTPEVIEDINRLRAYHRSAVKDAIKRKLRFLPTKPSRSGIKAAVSKSTCSHPAAGQSLVSIRLRRLLNQRLARRLNSYRVFYDVFEAEVVILAILHKDEADDWLAQFGVEENETDRLVCSKR